MSVKLPLLIKRQPISHQRSPSQINIQLKPTNSVIKPAEMEEDYDDDAQFQQEQFVQSAQPIETVVCLKKEENERQQQLTIELIKNKQEINIRESKFALSQLKRQFEEKNKLIIQLRQSIGDKKKQIKLIGDQVDKDLNKSILKVSKHTAINLRDIFSAPPKSANNRVNQIQEELKKVRLTIKKTKTEVQKITNGLTDAITLMNQERGSDFQTKIKKMDEDIKIIQNEKEMISSELSRKDYNQSEQEQRNAQCEKIQTQLNQLLNFQKEQKSKLYLIQKQDIFLMQKAKFFQEKESNLGNNKKSRVVEKDKGVLDEEIKEIIKEINQIIDERNRTQLERKLTVKNLISQSANLESKNWDVCNKLRDLDAFLLQYYQKKSRKKQLKTGQKMSQSMERSASNKIQVESIAQTPSRTKQNFTNDKNTKSYSVETIPVQKRKNYEFSLKQTDQDSIALSDEFLGNKLLLASILVIADQQKIYRIVCTYNNYKKQIKGLTMGSKSLPNNTSQFTIKMDAIKNEVINFIHIGFHENQHISYLQILTSEKNELKWGSIQNLSKSEQKYIKKYQSAFIKTKLSFDRVLTNGSQVFCVDGLTLSTIYLSSK